MRALAFVALLIGLALAQEKPRPDPEAVAEVVRELGGEGPWGELPRWRQEMILRRYARFLELPEEQQSRIRRHGLREYLIKPEQAVRPDDLPEPILRAIEGLPAQVRRGALKLATLRARHLRRDESLRCVPREERWALFERLYPEPFDREVAQRAHEELKRHVARTWAAHIRSQLARIEEERGGELEEEERSRLARRLLEQAAREQERRLTDRIRRELSPLEGADPRRVKQLLERHGMPLLERLRFMTPRQRELVRYAAEPFDCPLLDLDFLGLPPEDPERLRAWGQDYRLFGRLELLAAAGFNREMVLHLASTGPPEDFLRAVHALLGPSRGRWGGR